MACFERRHYVAAVNMFRVYERPADLFGRYLLHRGTYPATVRVRTPIGPLDLDVYTSHDVLTINEIFCRVDYPANDQSVFVDFGSNIGISAAYFLSRNRHAFVYLYEPLPMNHDRLRKNLQPFEGRYELNAVAVGPSAGTVQFGWEGTGRYGGVGRENSQQIAVQCLDSNAVLEQVIQKHGKIDVLKIDIETLELAVTERIPQDLARQIRAIYVEYPFRSNPLSRTHSFIQHGSVARFVSLSFAHTRK
jgi:FkbM family methyltransferase